jgi:hypothetical protein
MKNGREGEREQEREERETEERGREGEREGERREKEGGRERERESDMTLAASWGGCCRIHAVHLELPAESAAITVPSPNLCVAGHSAPPFQCSQFCINVRPDAMCTLVTSFRAAGLPSVRRPFGSAARVYHSKTHAD